MASQSSWISRFSSPSSSSRRFHFRSAFEEPETMEEDRKVEYMCPFCAEDFDVVGLCCHIDEAHPVEAKNGVCPVCTTKTGANIVSHITMQHGNFFKMQRKRRLRKGVSNSTFSMLKKELREGSLQSFVDGSSYISSSNTEPDPLLFSFMSNLPGHDGSVSSAKALSPVESSSTKGRTNEDVAERKMQQPILSEKDQEEKSRKCEFVQGVLLSTIFDDKVTI